MVVLRTPLDPLRPSEYTASLIQALRLNPGRVLGARVLEVGCGSGVVLAALAGLGAASLCGTDIVPEAVLASRRLLGSLANGVSADILQGDMWSPVAGRRFDLIVANLPHFPTMADDFIGRLPSWSAGGPDGRRLLDRFLEGLARHLTPGGRAVITHNAFVGLDRTRSLLMPLGLSLRVVATAMLYVPEDKLSRMTGGVLAAEAGRSIHRFGPYAFGDMHIVEIGRPGTCR